MQLEIKTPQFPATIEFNFDELKAELTAALAKYKGLTYTDDQIKEAKADRASLNKFRDAIEAKRKELKKTCLTPYEDFEKRVKELTALIDAPIAEIDVQIKAADEKKKAAKKEQLLAFWENNVNSECKKYFAFNDVFCEKMLNTTVSLQSAKEMIIEVVIKAENDLKVIADIAEKYRAAALDAYLKSKSLSDAVQTAKKLETLDRKIEPPQPSPAPVPANDTKVSGEILTASFRVSGTRDQLIALRDFIRANEIKIEPVTGMNDEDLFQLIKDSLTLRNLYAAGVDNWVGFDEFEKPTHQEIRKELETYKK